jgi:hypothetical protein
MTFKKGQRVWWEAPNNEHSGEYDVLDSQDELNMGKPENERIIHIGDGKKTWNVPADYLTIVCPISDVDREQLAMQEHRNHIRDKELLVRYMRRENCWSRCRRSSPGSKTKISKQKETQSVSVTKTMTPAVFSGLS